MRNVVLQYWRVLACISIVFHHTLCAIFGNWPPIGHPLINDIPSWAGNISFQAKALGLDGFTFISGAVLYYSMNKHLSFFRFLWNKIKRILVPMLVFALMYKILFPQLMFSTFPAPINGTHLWYLPMIFLCIMIVSLHFYSHNAFWWIMLIYVGLMRLNHYTDFRTIGELYSYFPVFYAGFLSNYFFNQGEHLIHRLKNPQTFERYIICIIVIGVVLLYSKVVNKISNIPHLSVCLLYSCMFISLSSIVSTSANGVQKFNGGGVFAMFAER